VNSPFIPSIVDYELRIGNCDHENGDENDNDNESDHDLDDHDGVRDNRTHRITL
jgi:hypothetical protein